MTVASQACVFIHQSFSLNKQINKICQYEQSGSSLSKLIFSEELPLEFCELKRSLNHCFMAGLYNLKSNIFKWV